MGTLLQNVRYGLRMLMKNPIFTAVAVVTLALGIGANSSIFSLVNAVLIRPLPYPQPQQLVGLGQWRNVPGRGYTQAGVSAPNILDIQKQNQAFQQVCFYQGSPFNITEGNRPEHIQGAKISPDLLPMFGIQPLVGRFFSQRETLPGQDQVAILSEHLWAMRYGSDPAILGKTIDLNQSRYVIVGVMPAAFRFTWDQEMDVLVPFALGPERFGDAGRNLRDLETLARIKPGVSIEGAQAAMDSMASALAQAYPAANKGWGIKVEPLHAAYHRNMQTPLLIMMGAVGCVLLIACANVANLLLARATSRRREIALRLAIGASRGRLIVQLLTESLLLAALGGTLGLLLTVAADRLLTFGLERYYQIPNARVVNLDWRVAIFSIAITLATGIIFGLVPALVTSKGNLSDWLREGGQGSTPERGRRRLRNVLVLSEVALALVLMTAAGLLVRTFISLSQVELGMNPANLLMGGISLPTYKYAQTAQQLRFFDELLQRLQATPGVSAAGASASGGSVFFQPTDQAAAAPGQEPSANYNIVTPRYFSAMGTALLVGRPFSDTDTQDSPQVAIINETLARRYWPASSAVGKKVTILADVYYRAQTRPTSLTLEVVGVAKDVRLGQQLWLPLPAIFVPYRQHPVASAGVMVRTAGTPMGMAQAFRDAVLALDNQLPVNNVRTAEQNVAQMYGYMQFPMMLLWIFAGMALLISAAGIFGVMSYSVSQRTRELAIRMALGAEPQAVQRLVLREGLSVTAMGVIVGLVAALCMTRIMSRYVFGIGSTDPATFVGASLLLMLVALVASFVPARRATHVDPMVALRYE